MKLKLEQDMYGDDVPLPATSMADLVMIWFMGNHTYYYQKMVESTNAYENGEIKILNKWHHEDNVWEHTKLVMEEYEKLPDHNIVGMLACLLHDLGKIEARYVNHDKQKVTYYGHANLCNYEAFQILEHYAYEFPGTINYEDIINIMIMKKWHLEAFFRKDKDRIINAFKEQKYFNIFRDVVKSDNLGRIHDNVQENLTFFDNIKIKPHKYGNKHKIIFNVGCSGSGKSTNSSGTVLSYDTMRINSYMDYTNTSKMSSKELYHNAFEYCKGQNLRAKLIDATKCIGDCTIDNTNLTDKTRDYLCKELHENKLEAEVYLLPKKIILQNNQKRKDKIIPLDVVQKQYKICTFPDYYYFSNIVVK